VTRQEIDYNTLENKIIEFLQNKRAIVVATSQNNRVTARTVSFVNIGLQIFFWSYENHTKCHQIRVNPKVALCRDNLQVEGMAELKGSVLDKKNETYLSKFKEKFPKDYDRYANEPKMILVDITPTLFVLLVNEDGNLYRDHLNIEEGTAFRIELKE
jgi:uncharacterized pyridoxamine 5'-phosphate oxidase family protein